MMDLKIIESAQCIISEIGSAWAWCLTQRSELRNHDMR